MAVLLKSENSSEVEKPSAVRVCAEGQKEGQGDPRAGLAPLGLSLSQICTLNAGRLVWSEGSAEVGEFEITVAGGGSCVKLRQVSEPQNRVRRGGLRCASRGFSRSSHLHMLTTVNSLDRTKVAGSFFVTLTSRHDVDAEATEKDWRLIEIRRRRWFRRFRERWANHRWVALWKKEPHKSGHVHLHLLIFWLDALPHMVKEFRPWNDRAWAEVVDRKNPDYLAPACHSEFMRGWGGVAYYCAKYCAKEFESGLVRTGRVWGVENRHLLPFVQSLSRMVVPERIGVRAKRVLRKLLERRRSYWLSQSVDWQYRESGKWHFVRAEKDCPADVAVERLRRRGLPVRRGWHRVRAGPYKISSNLPAVRLSESQAVEWLRSTGVRLKRRKGRACRRETIPIWSVECDTGRMTRDLEYWFQPEKRCITTGLHFVRDADFLGLLNSLVLQDVDVGGDDLVPF